MVGVEGHDTARWISLIPIRLQGGHKIVFITSGCKELWAWPSLVKAHAIIRKVETKQVVAKLFGK